MKMQTVYREAGRYVDILQGTCKIHHGFLTETKFDFEFDFFFFFASHCSLKEFSKKALAK